MIPIHPQPSPDHPDELRWITPPGILPFTGAVAAVPEPLATVIADGTLAAVRVEPGAVVTRLGEARTWSVDGPRVRTAVHEALTQPSGWRRAAGADEGADAPLLAAARGLIDGQVGDFARSHGGSIELVGVHDGVVEVRLGGACHGCPAAQVTMRVRLERQLRARCCELREVRNVGAAGARGTR